MGDHDLPVPVVVRVRLGIALHQVDRGVDVAVLVEDPHVDREVRPVVGKRVDDLLEGVREAHGRSLAGSRGGARSGRGRYPISVSYTRKPLSAMIIAATMLAATVVRPRLTSAPITSRRRVSSTSGTSANGMPNESTTWLITSDLVGFRPSASTISAGIIVASRRRASGTARSMKPCMTTCPA